METGKLKLALSAGAVALSMALAGCGGSSSNGGAQSNGNPDSSSTSNTGTKSVALPEGNRLSAGDVDSEITIEVGKPRDVQGTYFICTGDENCVITVSAGANVSTATYTGGTLMAFPGRADAPTQTVSGGTKQPDSGYLSDATLLEALKIGDSKKTIWTAKGGTFGDGAPMNRKLVNGETIILTPNSLGSSDRSIYWGHWQRYQQATENGPKTEESYGTVYGGTTRYDRNPATLNGISGKATYEGGAGGVEILSSVDNGRTWKGGGSATLSLEANFTRGKISGTVTGVNLGDLTTREQDNDILLKETDIGSVGTFSGMAEFSASGIKRQSGNWEGAFFGETTTRNGADPLTQTQTYSDPSHVAGKFFVTRDEIKNSEGTTTQDDLTIHGAFGAPKTSTTP